MPIEDPCRGGLRGEPRPLESRPPGAPGPSLDNSLRDLVGLLRGRLAVVLAGAGCSTESGIPDYRGPQGRLRTRRPMLYQEFVGSAEGRARYWSRSAVGWPAFSVAQPNPAHVALAEMERQGLLAGMITQNVDGLHHAAGSREVVELHGSLGRVRCLDCGESLPRRTFQDLLLSLNGAWLERVQRAGGAVESAPDGDAELSAETLAGFRVPGCRVCHGVLKPDVVFFGENVPRARVDAAWRLMQEAEVLLVVGSSLTVFSGRRFVYGAKKTGIPVGIVNLGPTRGDDLADLKVEARVGDVLPRLVRELGYLPRP